MKPRPATVAARKRAVKARRVTQAAKLRKQLAKAKRDRVAEFHAHVKRAMLKRISPTKAKDADAG